MSKADWSGDLAHHAYEAAPFRLPFPAVLPHRVTLHLVLFQGHLATLGGVLFVPRSAAVQSFPSVVFEIVMGHYCVSEFKYYLRLDVVSFVYCALIAPQGFRSLCERHHRLVSNFRVVGHSAQRRCGVAFAPLLKVAAGADQVGCSH